MNLPTSPRKGNMNRQLEELRTQSPRPGTPELDSRQGRRNGVAGVQLLDTDGAISSQVYPHRQRCSLYS